MVRVFRCHCFASKQVIPITKEPLTICSSGDKVFVATSDCEMLVFCVKDGKSEQIQRLPTISQVEKMIFNSFKSYIATVEQKKSWKKMTHSVRVYLNWEGNQKNSMPRTKVRVAGKSHVQHVSATSSQSLMEIIEIPMDKHATGLAVCSQTGNFAVACSYEVKLCSLVEKTVANSDRTYLDVEIFLELCWNFNIQSIALCEEFVVCCSKSEVQGICVRYDEGKEPSSRGFRSAMATPISSTGFKMRKGSQTTLEGGVQGSPISTSPRSSVSDIDTPNAAFDEEKDLVSKMQWRHQSLNSFSPESYKDLSTVGRRLTFPSFPKPGAHTITDRPTLPVDDENFVEWNFLQSQTSNHIACLPGLHTDRGHSQCHRHFQDVSPPVLSDFSGGKVKSSSGVQAQTVLYLSDTSEKEEWMHIVLVPSYEPGPGQLLAALGTDRMTSARHPIRTSVCCFVSGTRSGYLYQLSPLLNKISSYQYTDRAAQVSCGGQYLYVVTQNGIETYTSRWAAVALESKHRGLWQKKGPEPVHPPSSLDICLCGHEPFPGVVDMCAGSNFVSLLSKMEYPSSSADEMVWSFSIVHCQSIVDQCKDMLHFAESVRETGPSSYVHLLQEAHLLLSTYKAEVQEDSEELESCLNKLKKLLGDVYAQPGEEGWRLCHFYYNSLGISLDGIVQQAAEKARQKGSPEYGKGLLDFLDKKLFSEEMDSSFPPTPSTAEEILNIYANACPEQLSKLILLSNLTGYKPESALQHLSKWLSLKTDGGHMMSTVDKLALVQIHLTQCEVEMACSKLDSIIKPDLGEVCCNYPRLLHTDHKSFTSLGQLMRWHMPQGTMEVLVEMLDQGLFSLDSLLVLLQSQDLSDIHHNSHVKQVLELVLNDNRRNYIFEEAVNLLCEIYISSLKEKKTYSSRHIGQRQQIKFSLPSGNGHFAPRFGWLDELPPFHGSDHMLRPCQNLEVKRGLGKGLRMGSNSAPVASKQEERGNCSCCLCHENLLKLQSLLCSPNLTSSLAHHILDLLRNPDQETGQTVTTFQELDPFWDSVQLLCFTKLDWKVATENIVEKYPLVVANFSTLLYAGDISKYSFLMQSMEKMLKSCTTSTPAKDEQACVKAYKDLLNRLAELFPPSQFVPLLPRDSNLFFLLPFITRNLELENSNSLKRNILKMGKELLFQNN